MSRTLHAEIEKLPLKSPFRITGYTFVHIEVAVVTLRQDGRTGRGEATGVYYLKDDAAHMMQQIEAARSAIESGVDRQALQQLMPAGGARNAVDCALWDLEAKLAGQPAWQLAGLQPPRPLITTYTLGAESPDVMVAGAKGYAEARALKLKLTGTPEDRERVIAVREARPDVWLGVDANQGFTRDFLEKLLPTFVDAKVALIEQPFKVGEEAQLDGLQSPIPIAADETLQTLRDLPTVVSRFDVVNIKLDKCGGLTEALAIAREAQRLGRDVMVGNMVGTSLAMAPSFLIGQLCKVVDLDGPTFLKADRTPGVVYQDGKISCPETVWGGAGG
jgi:L-Ala-D/L-Glu epimerase